MSLKDTWKSTGSDLGNAFKGLGKSIIKSASTAVNKADNWANSEEKKSDEEEKTEE